MARPLRNCLSYLLGVLLTVFLFGGGCVLLWVVNVPSSSHPNFDRLLRGDRDVRLMSVYFDPVRADGFELTDQEALDHLTDALRGATHEGYYPKGHGEKCVWYHYPELRVSPGRPVKAALTVTDVDGFYLNYPLDGWEDLPCYWVPMPQPMPPALRAAFDRLKR